MDEKRIFGFIIDFEDRRRLTAIDVYVRWYGIDTGSKTDKASRVGCKLAKCSKRCKAFKADDCSAKALVLTVARGGKCKQASVVGEEN